MHDGRNSIEEEKATQMNLSNVNGLCGVFCSDFFIVYIVRWCGRVWNARTMIRLDFNEATAFSCITVCGSLLMPLTHNSNFYEFTLYFLGC